MQNIDSHYRLACDSNLQWHFWLLKMFKVWGNKPSGCSEPWFGASTPLNLPLWCPCPFSSSPTPVWVPWLGPDDRGALAPILCSWCWRLEFLPDGKPIRFFTINSYAWIFSLVQITWTRQNTTIFLRQVQHVTLETVVSIERDKLVWTSRVKQTCLSDVLISCAEGKNEDAIQH